MQVGAKILLLVEKCQNARAVLRVHFLDVPIAHDVSELLELPRGTNILTAGPPCVNVSMQGLGEGLMGEVGSKCVRYLSLMCRVSRAGDYVRCSLCGPCVGVIVGAACLQTAPSSGEQVVCG